MSEWEEKLNTLLSDPDAMAQVMNMAAKLVCSRMGQSGGSAPPSPAAGGAAGPAPSAPPPPPSRRAIRWAIFRRCSAALTPA